MRKALVSVALLIGVALLARLLSPKLKGVDWEARLERMPDNAPPKWMFRNISAIRENTDRILELLGRQQGGASGSAIAT